MAFVTIIFIHRNFKYFNTRFANGTKHLFQVCKHDSKKIEIPPFSEQTATEHGSCS